MAVILSNYLKKSLLDGNVDLSKDTLQLSFNSAGQGVIDTPSWTDYVFNLLKRNLALQSKPIFKAHSAFIYMDTGEYAKYWDVGMPVKGTGSRILAAFDVKDV